jgi:hypothetical protein
MILDGGPTKKAFGLIITQITNGNGDSKMRATRVLLLAGLGFGLAMFLVDRLERMPFDRGHECKTVRC